MQKAINLAFFALGSLLSFLAFSKLQEVSPAQPHIQGTSEKAALDMGHSSERRMGLPEGPPEAAASINAAPSTRQLVNIDEDAWAQTDAAKAFIESLVHDLGADWVTPLSPKAEASGKFVGGVRNGEWSVYWPERGWTNRGKYVLGARHGEWRMYDSSGKLIRISNYYCGKLDGEMKDRDSSSGTWTPYYYRDGELVTASEIRRNNPER